MNTYGYPAQRITIEKGVQFGSSVDEKRADIVISDEHDPKVAYIIVEVKKPKRKDGLEQLKSYCNAEGAPIAVWTNGSETVIMHREDPNFYRNISDIPRYDQTLAEIINERVTLDELRANNKLVTEKWTLKKIIEDLEDLVLANAGVDAFDEVFKLIYAKMYDEYTAARKRKGEQYVEFRAAGETHKKLYDKISGLFNKAKERWDGVFLRDDKIELTPTHLAVCVSFLQDIALFNSNLQIIDEAFEYLVTKVSKGEKGQYFTPRHVIDMAVKMMNPQLEEYMIDTAAGSCGFTVHTLFHVGGGEMTAAGPSDYIREYASEKLFGLDFDARSVKIAKAINLIAGDGKTNVYRVNTLAPHDWDEDARVGLKTRLMRYDDNAQDRWNREHYRDFDFDVLLTNPPFAGDIKDSRILNQYDLAKKWRGVNGEVVDDEESSDEDAGASGRFEFKESGKRADKQGRDVLFIERNLQFLKPGGRMAIVLPQGRLNNITDAYVRWWISQHCRILAVVGLHVNTFKPHTGTKTSVLFLQKWDDDPQAGPLCPKVDNYPIFFATSQQPGKDNSGDYIYRKDQNGDLLLDDHNHKIVQHDLDDIANAFVLFAQKHHFSFWAGQPVPF